MAGEANCYRWWPRINWKHNFSLLSPIAPSADLKHLSPTLDATQIARIPFSQVPFTMLFQREGSSVASRLPLPLRHHKRKVYTAYISVCTRPLVLTTNMWVNGISLDIIKWQSSPIATIPHKKYDFLCLYRLAYIPSDANDSCLLQTSSGILLFLLERYRK